MQCLNCKTEMQEREGRYGSFYFCPNQRYCGMKTITKIPVYESTTYSVDNSGSVYKQSEHTGLIDNRRPFDPEVDDHFYDDGSDFRPW